MGYDMYTVQEADAEEKTAVETALAATRALPNPFALTEGSDEYTAAKKAYDEAWAAYDAAQKSYFRLNIWGMSIARDLMNTVGMLTDEPMPEFPDMDNYGLDEYPDEDSENLTSAERDYLIAQRGALSHEPPIVSGIPVYKLCSNEGWLVTEAQCAVALSKWNAAPNEVRVAVEMKAEWWPSWITFLGHSKDRGGFRVH
jgi:hypothetical protein